MAACAGVVSLLITMQLRKNTMKTYSTNRAARALTIACALIVTIFGTIQAASPNSESNRDAITDSGSSEPLNDARLIVRRIPNLGNNVIVDLYIDGVAASPIVYGQTYEGFIPPGRHVLSVVASPHPKWPTPTQLILDARKGETYSFTAMGDGSGQLILNGA
jgi:hypothetical protein